MAHHRVGRVQNVAGTAVVLLELDHLGLLEVLLKVKDVGDIGTAPRVNRLVVIAHHHKVLVLGGKQVGDLVLHVVGVLVLVHGDVAKTLLVLIQHLRAGAQQLERANQQVVEVHGVGGAQAALQFGVDLRGLALLGVRRLLQHLVRAHHGVLGRRDLAADHVDGEVLLVYVQALHDLAHHAARIVVIVDGELAGVAQQVGVLAQHAHAHGVERAHPHAAGAIGQKRAQALAHLRGGFVGKGDGQDLPGADAQIRDHMGDAIGQHARLTRPCARQHQQRPFRGHHGLALGGVQRIDIDLGQRRRSHARGRVIRGRVSLCRNVVRRHIGLRGRALIGRDVLARRRAVGV